MSVEIIEAPAPAVSRSPADVLRLLVAAAAVTIELLLQVVFGDEIVDGLADFLRGFDELAPNLVGVIVLATWGLGIVLIVAGIVAIATNSEWRGGLTVMIAGIAAAGVAALISAFDEPTSPPVGEVADWYQDIAARAHASELALAFFTAAVTAAAPWVPRRWRRLGWLLLIGLVIARSVATPVAFSSVRALLVGWFVGAAVIVIMGGPTRRPNGASIAAGLAAVGLPMARLEQASLDARGSTPYFGVAENGSKLFVKALGRDERSADLMFRMYRSALPRDLGDERGFKSLRRAVEHEALLALAARDQGVRTPRFVALATAEPDGFVLTYEAIDGKSLDRVDDDQLDDAKLQAIWAQIMVLRDRRIAHRDLRLANIFLGADGEIWMIDFGFSELAASDTLLATDLAELLASLSLKVGPDRAVAVATEFLQPEELTTALDRLHLWALAGATRTAYKGTSGGLEPLRTRIAAAAQ